MILTRLAVCVCVSCRMRFVIISWIIYLPIFLPNSVFVSSLFVSVNLSMSCPRVCLSLIVWNLWPISGRACVCVCECVVRHGPLLLWSIWHWPSVSIANGSVSILICFTRSPSFTAHVAFCLLFSTHSFFFFFYWQHDSWTLFGMDSGDTNPLRMDSSKLPRLTPFSK